MKGFVVVIIGCSWFLLKLSFLRTVFIEPSSRRVDAAEKQTVKSGVRRSAGCLCWNLAAELVSAAFYSPLHIRRPAVCLIQPFSSIERFFKVLHKKHVA